MNPSVLAAAIIALNSAAHGTPASDKPLYHRDFLLRGNAPREIVQVTYTGPSPAVFTNKAIINSVRPR